jgi:3-polyprenyl-4-hydroxybenzoate decarboxylase
MLIYEKKKKWYHKNSERSVKMHRRLIIGISGASGSIYGVTLLRMLQKLPFEIHLVISKPGLLTLRYEMNLGLTALFCTHIF